MSAALTERLVSVARAARDVGHGKRGAIYEAACTELGLSCAHAAAQAEGGRCD